MSTFEVECSNGRILPNSGMVLGEAILEQGRILGGDEAT